MSRHPETKGVGWSGCSRLATARSTRAGLSALLTAADVGLVVDVRRFPGSRHNPDVSLDAMAQWLPDAGVHYRWEQQLGGRLHGAVDGPHVDLFPVGQCGIALRAEVIGLLTIRAAAWMGGTCLAPSGS